MKKSHRILLINVYHGEYQMAQHIPLGLLSIGTLLHKNGYAVKILNASDYFNEYETVLW